MPWALRTGVAGPTDRGPSDYGISRGHPSQAPPSGTERPFRYAMSNVTSLPVTSNPASGRKDRDGCGTRSHSSSVVPRCSWWQALDHVSIPPRSMCLPADSERGPPSSTVSSTRFPLCGLPLSGLYLYSGRVCQWESLDIYTHVHGLLGPHTYPYLTGC